MRSGTPVGTVAPHTDNLRQLFADVEDTRELVLPPLVTAAQWADELFAVWTAARAEANIALDEWRANPGRESYTVFRAAEDRCDAAECALAEFSAARRRQTGDALPLAA